MADVDTRRQSLEREQLERDRVRRLLDEMDQAKTCVRTDPKASEAYGYQTELDRGVAELQAGLDLPTKTTTAQPAVESTPQVSDLDPELAKVLEHPQIRAVGCRG